MALPDLKSGLLAQIQKLMNPTAQSLAESDTNAAAANLASGVPGASQFGQNRGLVLRDSEQQKRLKLASDLYQPLLQIESSEKIAANSQAGEDRRLAESGRQARERLEISERGEGERLSAQQAQQLKLQALEGEQAMARLNATNQFESGRQGEEIASRERIANAGISADMARQAMSEAGLNARLSQSAQNEMQQAILRGDQARQLQLLQDAGANERQILQLQNALEQQRIQGEQQMRVQSAGAGNNARQAILEASLRTQPNTTSPARPATYADTYSRFNGMQPGPQIAPATPPRNTGTINSSTLDRLLAQYGVTSQRDLSRAYGF